MLKTKIIMLKKFPITYIKMFRRLISVGYQQARVNRFGDAVRRNFYKDDGDGSLWIPGGGLEKLQGGIKEEKYFNDHDMALLAKMRADRSMKLKCENCVSGNWTEYEKVAYANSELAAMRQTCALNRYKDYREEAYFMDEQTSNLRILGSKLKQNSLVEDVQMVLAGIAKAKD